MNSIPIRELNQNTSAILARVAGGETLEITVNGRPTARLTPVQSDRPENEGLAELARRGRMILASDPSGIPLPAGEPDPDGLATQAVSDLRDERG